MHFFLIVLLFVSPTAKATEREAWEDMLCEQLLKASGVDLTAYFSTRPSLPTGGGHPPISARLKSMQDAEDALKEMQPVTDVHELTAEVDRIVRKGFQDGELPLESLKVLMEANEPFSRGALLGAVSKTGGNVIKLMPGWAAALQRLGARARSSPPEWGATVRTKIRELRDDLQKAREERNGSHALPLPLPIEEAQLLRWKAQAPPKAAGAPVSREPREASPYEQWLGPLELFVRESHAAGHLSSARIAAMARAQSPLQIGVRDTDSALMYLARLLARLERKVPRDDQALALAIRARLDSLARELGGKSGSTARLRSETNEARYHFRVPGLTVNGDFALTPDGKHLLPNGSLIEVSTGKAKVRYPVGDNVDGPLHSEISADGRWLLTDGGGTGTVLYDLATGEPKARLPFPATKRPSMAIAPDGDRMALLVQSGKDHFNAPAHDLLELELPSFDLRHRLSLWDPRPAAQGHWPKNPGLRHRDNPSGRLVTYSTDSSLLALQRNGTIDIWKGEERGFEGSLVLGEFVPTAISFQPEGRFLYGVNADQGVLRWELSTGEPETTVSQQGNSTLSPKLAVSRFTPNNEFVVSLVRHAMMPRVSPNQIDILNARLPDRHSWKLGHVRFDTLKMSADGRTAGVSDKSGGLWIVRIDEMIHDRWGSPP